MKILFLADEESRYFWDFFSPDKLEGIELIVSCGDLSRAYLEFLVTMTKCPVLYVPGNHDSRFEKEPPEGCFCIDDSIFEYKGIRFLGLGGSMKYKPGPYMYTEKEMRHRIWRLKQKIFNHGGFDILVTHAPARGYGDMEDMPHLGFECFNTLMEKCRPLYMCHGHVHANYSSDFERIRKHPCGTVIVNAYERFILELKDGERNTISRRDIARNLRRAFI